MSLVAPLIRGKILPHLKGYLKQPDRGMNFWIDYVDWVGGYPFEVAKPEIIFHHLYNKGFQLQKLKTCAGGHGCNEFIFKKNS